MSRLMMPAAVDRLGGKRRCLSARCASRAGSTLRHRTTSRPHRPLRVPADGVLSVNSLWEVLGPVVSAVGVALRRSLGVEDDLALHLGRADVDLDPTALRLRPAARSVPGVALGVGAVAGLGTLVAMAVAAGPRCHPGNT